MPFKDATVRKERLTLTQLACYDDILTDVLVDHVSNNINLPSLLTDLLSLLTKVLTCVLGLLLDHYPKEQSKIQSDPGNI